tara:strand:- start:12683 stop:13768 length:1086 start_codon:yes stop_codon:yes gene_type:complete
MRSKQIFRLLSGGLGSLFLPRYEIYTKLIIKSDGSSWVLNSIANEMEQLCRDLKIDTLDHKYEKFIKKQCIFYTSKYSVLSDWKKPKNRIAFPYYHGDPASSKRFYKMIKIIEKNHSHISRIQVSHSQMEDIILNTGIDNGKVFKIPISIDLNLFSLGDDFKKNQARKKLNIDQNKIVIGSFQKDGDGWGDGNIPKLIKGPDLFLETIKILKDKYKDIEVLLTGPSRGFVKKGLEKLNIKYHHYYINNYEKIEKYYHALDLYLITSREEGGPRAVLESMATGVPLVTFKVGQAIDLVNHGKNGWLAETEDTEQLAHHAEYVINNTSIIDNIKDNARKTAKENSYKSQIPLWQNFMHGFINE